ncbi:MAG: hypothetical protein ACKVPX_13920 [Myxococcaceae bacterium]
MVAGLNSNLNTTSISQGRSVWDIRGVADRSGTNGALDLGKSDFIAAAAMGTAGLLFNRNKNGTVDNNSGVMTPEGGTIPMPDGQRRTPQALLASLKPKERAKALAGESFKFKARGPDGKMKTYKAEWGSMDGHTPSLFFEKARSKWKTALKWTAIGVGVAAAAWFTLGGGIGAVTGAASSGATAGGGAAGAAASAGASAAASTGAAAGTSAAAGTGFVAKATTAYKAYTTARAGVNAYNGFRDGNLRGGFFNAAGAFAGSTNLGLPSSNLARAASNVNFGTQVTFGTEAALRRRDMTGLAANAMAGVAFGAGFNDNIDPMRLDQLNRGAQVARGVDVAYKGLQYRSPQMMWGGYDQVRRGTRQPPVFHFPVDGSNNTSTTTPPFRAVKFQTLNG